MATAEIVSMTDWHLPEVAAIEQQVTPHPWSATQFQQSLAQHNALVLLVGQQVVGYLVYSVVLDESEILNIAVSPNFQQQGFAKQLFLYYLDALPATITDTFLEVRSSNVPAINLYQQLGFVQTGCRKNYYTTSAGQKEDALLMHWQRLTGD